MNCATFRVNVAVGGQECFTNRHLVYFSEDGHNIACALGNKSALVFPLPLSKSCTSYTGTTLFIRSMS